MSERVELVCAKCGEPGRLSRDVSVAGWEAVNVYRGDDGKPVEETTGERDVDWSATPDMWGYSCSECGGSWATLEAAVADPEYDCPQCSGCGCPRCTYTGRETHPPEPHPGQLRIEAA